MALEDIGFYTLSDARCEQLGAQSPMWRCELILTDRCNFSCVYCRGLRKDVRGTLPLTNALAVLDLWIADGLKHVRFSGGEPLLYPHLDTLVRQAAVNCERVAISTNGSFPTERYLDLAALGVNDFSMSLDACCAADATPMAGRDLTSIFDVVIDNIRALAKVAYVTVGIVITKENTHRAEQIIAFAHDLGAADIRIVPAAQEGTIIDGLTDVPARLLKAHPILKYRITNMLKGRPVRSIQEYDSHRCFMPIDDSVVASDYHFPCVIYMREGGDPIGRVSATMRQARIAWSERHDTFADPICRANCLDVCVDHNNYCACIRRHERTILEVPPYSLTAR